MAKKTLSLEILLQDKKVIKPKKWTYDSDELGCTVEIEKIKPSQVSKIINDMQEGSIDDYTACLMLIFESVSIFRAKELLQRYTVAEPFEIVDKVFDRNMGEIYELGRQISANYGLNRQEVKDDIKK